MVVTKMSQWKAQQNPRQYGEEDNVVAKINNGELGLNR
jgi:hypothetical protein